MDPTKSVIQLQARVNVLKTRSVELVCLANVITTRTSVLEQKSVLNASLTPPGSPASIVPKDILVMQLISSVMVS